MKSSLLRSLLITSLAAAVSTMAVAQTQQTPPQTPPGQQPPPVIPGQSPRGPVTRNPPASTPAQTPTTQAPVTQAPPTQTPVTQPIPGQAPPAQPPATQAPPATREPAAVVPPPTTVPGQTPAVVPQAGQGMDFYIPSGSLSEFIDIVARKLGLNLILDPAVGGKGSVSLFTYGETKPTDLMTLLQTILRVNGATIVQVGDLYRIVPITKISVLPIDPKINVDQKTLPDDERMVLDLIFLKYTTAKEIDALISPFLGEGASHSVYEAANLLIIQDNARSMKRTLKLIDMFDAESFAGQRVRLFEISNSRPSDLVKELETVFKAYAMADKSSVRFIPVDRINTLIAVAPNPVVFPQVQEWIDKLDISVKVQAGEVSTYVYRLKYARAATTAMAITALFTGNINALMGLAAMAAPNNGQGGGFGGMNNGGGYGGGGYGGGGYGGGGYGGGGYGGGGYGGGGYGGGGYGGGNGFGNGTGFNTPTGMIPPISIPQAGSGSAIASPVSGPNTPDMTGLSLGAAGAGGSQTGGHFPHVIPNPFDNTLLIQGTPQEYQQITSLLRQLDVAPRQVLIEMKIYELDLTGAFSEGITAYLEQKGANGTGLGRALNIATGASGLGLSLGALVSHSKEILGVLQAQETHGISRIISAPSIIATDSIPATMNVGQDVPVLTSQAIVGGVQSSGSNLFTNTVSSQSSGVTMNILARVSPSGVVTMVIQQDVSSPQPPAAGGINSPSFQQRQFQTQLTMQDGDTVAIGGFIQDQSGNTATGVPLLSRIPILGGLFGAKSYNKARTELIVFITPKVIYDANQLLDATEEIQNGLDHLNKMIKDR